jgi:hypothetical protein
MHKLKYLLLSGLVSLAGCSNQKAIDFFNPEFNKAKEIKFVAEKDGKDYWQTPKETQELGTGDCEDIARYLEDLLKRSGKACACKITTGHYDAINRFLAPDSGHVWLECPFEGNLYVLDATTDVLAKKSKLKSKGNYLPPDSSILQTRLKDKTREYEERKTKDSKF